MDWCKRLLNSLKWKKEMDQKPLLVIDAVKYKAVCEAMGVDAHCNKCNERASRVFVLGDSYMIMNSPSCLKHLDTSAWT